MDISPSERVKIEKVIQKEMEVIRSELEKHGTDICRTEFLRGELHFGLTIIHRIQHGGRDTGTGRRN